MLTVYCFWRFYRFFSFLSFLRSVLETASVYNSHSEQMGYHRYNARYKWCQRSVSIWFFYLLGPHPLIPILTPLPHPPWTFSKQGRWRSKQLARQLRTKPCKSHCWRKLHICSRLPLNDWIGANSWTWRQHSSDHLRCGSSSIDAARIYWSKSDSHQLGLPRSCSFDCSSCKFDHCAYFNLQCARRCSRLAASLSFIMSAIFIMGSLPLVLRFSKVSCHYRILPFPLLNSYRNYNQSLWSTFSSLHNLTPSLISSKHYH